MGFPKHFKGFFFSNFVQYHSLNLRGFDAFVHILLLSPFMYAYQDFF